MHLLSKEKAMFASAPAMARLFPTSPGDPLKNEFAKTVIKALAKEVHDMFVQPITQLTYHTTTFDSMVLGPLVLVFTQVGPGDNLQDLTGTHEVG